MIFENVEDEKLYANKQIVAKIDNCTLSINSYLQEIKLTKKELKTLSKQKNCEHNFDLKQTSELDNYTCKKCKFLFSTLA